MGHIVRTQEIGFFSSMSQHPLLGQRLLIIEVLRSHSETPHSVRLFLDE